MTGRQVVSMFSAVVLHEADPRVVMTPNAAGCVDCGATYRRVNGPDVLRWLGVHVRLHQAGVLPVEPSPPPEPVQRPACGEPGCEQPARTRGWCQAHYARRWRRDRTGSR